MFVINHLSNLWYVIVTSSYDALSPDACDGIHLMSRCLIAWRIEIVGWLTANVPFYAWWHGYIHAFARRWLSLATGDFRRSGLLSVFSQKETGSTLKEFTVSSRQRGEPIGFAFHGETVNSGRSPCYVFDRVHLTVGFRLPAPPMVVACFVIVQWYYREERTKSVANSFRFVSAAKGCWNEFLWERKWAVVIFSEEFNIL
jgi:hypothetical protein